MERRSWVLAVTLALAGCALAWPGTSASERPEGASRSPAQEGLDGSRQERVRDGSHPQEPGVVHAPGRSGQRDLLPRPVDAQRAQPPADRRRRDDHRRAEHGHEHGGDPPGRRQPAVHPGEHGPRGQVPDHPRGRHRPRRGARWSSTPGSRPSTAAPTRWVSSTTLRSATAARTTGVGAMTGAWSPSTTTTRSRARWSPVPRSRSPRDRNDGDLVQTATLPTENGETTISLGFGHSRRQAVDTARAARSEPWTTTWPPTTPVGTSTSAP